jgi:peptidoglycan/LPS O-acetylase OafA/YrhL
MSGERGGGLRAPMPSTGYRLAGIEGLRAIAAGSIVVFHVWGFATTTGVRVGDGRWTGHAISTLSGGVTLFFTLSGFLLYRPFAAAIADGLPQPSIRRYLQNRALRIVPAYWFILAVTGLLVGAASIRGAQGHASVGRFHDPLDLVQAMFLVQDYNPSTVTIGIGPAWSLAVEVVFYCVLPLLVLGVASACRSVASRERRIVLLLVPPLILLGVGLSGKLAEALLSPGAPGWDADWHSVLERSFWVQADLFSFGMVVAVAHAQVSAGYWSIDSTLRRALASGGALILVVAAWHMHEREFSYTLLNTSEALAMALLLAALILPGRGSRPVALPLLESRPFVAAGVVSYSVFLWHLPLIEWLDKNGLTFDGGKLAFLGNLLAVGVVTGVLSALSYRFVEAPALHRKRSMRMSPETAVNAVELSAQSATQPA